MILIFVNNLKSHRSSFCQQQPPQLNKWREHQDRGEGAAFVQCAAGGYPGHSEFFNIYLRRSRSLCMRRDFTHPVKFINFVMLLGCVYFSYPVRMFVSSHFVPFIHYFFILSLTMLQTCTMSTGRLYEDDTRQIKMLMKINIYSIRLPILDVYLLILSSLRSLKSRPGGALRHWLIQK